MVPTIDDLLLHVPLSKLGGCARGWTFAAERSDLENDTSRTSVWYCDSSGRLQEIGHEGRGPTWLGDAAIAYLRSVDEQIQIFLRDPTEAEPRQITRPQLTYSSIQHGDDQRQRLLVLVVRRTQDGAPAPIVAEFLPYKTDGVGMTCQEYIELGMVDARTGDYTTLVGGSDLRGYDVLEAKWNPAGDAIAYLRRRGGAQRHRIDLWLRKEGEADRQLTQTLVSISGLSWSRDGKKLAMAGSTIEGDSSNVLQVFDVVEGTLREFEIELGSPSPAIRWNAHADCLLLIQAYRGTQRLVAMDLDGEVQVAWEHPERHVLDMAAQGARIGFIAAGLRDEPELWIADADGGNAHVASDFNGWRRSRPFLQGQWRAFVVPDGDGGTESIDGWLITPQGEGPFPLLLDMHGGPHTMVSFEHERYVHWPVLAAKGWAILALNAAGSSSYGRQFAHRIRGRWGELDWPQWQAAVEQLRQEGIASQAFAFGHSYGGFLAAWAMAHDTSLACGIASGPVINMESHTGTSDSGYYVGPYSMCGELQGRRERYHALSPLQHAHRIVAPTLLLQGEEDERCPKGQSEELFSTLIRAGRARARMVLFPEGSHHVSTTGRPTHRKAYFGEIVDWLEATRSTHG